LSAIRKAATVVLLRETSAGVEALLLRRHAAVQFAGGMWVFPGGAIDDSDFAGGDDLLVAAKNAAVRETREEAGLDISACPLQLFAHWTTPAGDSKRYATSFFIAAVAETAALCEVSVDGGEIVEHCWLTAAQAIAAHRAGQLNMMPPTFAALHDINTCSSIAAIVAMYRARPVVEIHPRRIETPEGRVVLYPGDAGYEHHDATLPGARHRMLRLADGLHYVRTQESAGDK
jgi:8-oxo-dGTP pyrophosphatase MutT (NUDIX family)